MNKIKSRIFELREIINNHNYHYYDLDKNLISDFEYDKLLNELVSNLSLNIQNFMMKILLQTELVVVCQINSTLNLMFFKCIPWIIHIQVKN